MADETPAAKPVVTATKVAKPKKQSRADRWSEAASTAKQALEELHEVQQEYQEWLDNLPENLQQSPVGEKLTTVCELDIEGAMSTVDEAESADLPLGFGRD